MGRIGLRIPAADHIVDGALGYRPVSPGIGLFSVESSSSFSLVPPAATVPFRHSSGRMEIARTRGLFLTPGVVPVRNGFPSSTSSGLSTAAGTKTPFGLFLRQTDIGFHPLLLAHRREPWRSAAGSGDGFDIKQARQKVNQFLRGEFQHKGIEGFYQLEEIDATTYLLLLHLPNPSDYNKVYTAVINLLKSSQFGERWTLFGRKVVLTGQTTQLVLLPFKDTRIVTVWNGPVPLEEVRKFLESTTNIMAGQREGLPRRFIEVRVRQVRGEWTFRVTTPIDGSPLTMIEADNLRRYWVETGVIDEQGLCFGCKLQFVTEADFEPKQAEPVVMRRAEKLRETLVAELERELDATIRFGVEIDDVSPFDPEPALFVTVSREQVAIVERAVDQVIARSFPGRGGVEDGLAELKARLNQSLAHLGLAPEGELLGRGATARLRLTIHDYRTSLVTMGHYQKELYLLSANFRERGWHLIIEDPGPLVGDGKVSQSFRLVPVERVYRNEILVVVEELGRIEPDVTVAAVTQEVGRWVELLRPQHNESVILAPYLAGEEPTLIVMVSDRLREALIREFMEELDEEHRFRGWTIAFVQPNGRLIELHRTGQHRVGNPLPNDRVVLATIAEYVEYLLNDDPLLGTPVAVTLVGQADPQARVDANGDSVDGGRTDGSIGQLVIGPKYGHGVAAFSANQIDTLREALRRHRLLIQGEDDNEQLMGIPLRFKRVPGEAMSRGGDWAEAAELARSLQARLRPDFGMPGDDFRVVVAPLAPGNPDPIIEVQLPDSKLSNTQSVQPVVRSEIVQATVKHAVEIEDPEAFARTGLYQGRFPVRIRMFPDDQFRLMTSPK